jgi:4-hydroxy 2-oxovalerate aldolase
MKKESSLEILDCTIRDGGYLNNWAFDKSLVRELYRNLSRAGINFIEIGFRNQQPSDSGIWCSTPEELINEVCDGISGAGIVLLVDLGKAALDKIPPAEKSLVRLYRVACHKTDVVKAVELSEAIKAGGYLVSLNLMGIVNYSQEELQALVPLIKNSTIDYAYFADSYGSLFPHDIKGYIDVLKLTGKKIGFHPHNNLQLAFANTLEALRNGADIVDGTIFGMGRGAGNLPLEILLTYLERVQKHDKYNSLPVLDLIDRFFLKMNQELRWGYNLPYMLSGSNAVHPNYAKDMMERYYYTIDDMVKVLDVVKDFKPVGYDKGLMDKIIQSGFVKPKDEISKDEIDPNAFKEIQGKYPVSYAGRHKKKDFLVLANGPSLKEFKSDIDEFIRQTDPIILGANNLEHLFVPHYHVFSNKKRFMSYIDQVDENSKLLISSTFEESFIRDYTDCEYERLVHLNRFSSQFSIQDGVINSHCGTVAVLLIATAIVMGAERIFIAGMDGYKDKDHLVTKGIHFYDENNQDNKEFNDFRAYLDIHQSNENLLQKINAYLCDRGQEGLTVITPTSHKYFYRNIQHFSLK